VLLIDVRGYVRSLASHHATVPYVRERFRHDLVRVDTLFRWCQRDFGFLGALQTEMQACLSWRLGAHPYPDALLDAARRAIADGLIAVASELPNDWVLRFDEVRATEWDSHQLVVFPTVQMQERFVVKALETSGGRAAIAAAISDVAGRADRGIREPRGNGSLAVQASELLASRVLAVVPREQARSVWWLVWVQYSAPTRVTTVYVPAPPQKSAPPPQPQHSTARVSVLPDAPHDLSPQAEALVAAAEDGVPFCEECARAQAAEPAYA
jgi:hypothetical protein